MRAMILAADGFEDSEFLYPYYRLQEAGFAVDIVGAQAGATVRGKHGVPVKADRAASDVSMADYDVLVVPGGRAPDVMRRSADMVRLVKEAFEAEKPVAAICHGPQLLIEADVLRGRTATCFASVATDVRNAGAKVVDEEVVVDGHLVTSRRPGDLPAFCRALLEVAGRREATPPRAQAPST